MKEKSLRIRIGRGLYLLFAVLFIFCITMQFYIAGMAVFDNPIHWLHHTTFIHIFGFNLPVLMLVAAFIGAMPRKVYWSLFGAFILMFMMYFTANTGIGALHPVFAVGLLMLSVWMVIAAFRLTFVNEKEEAA